ncbi:MAG: metallophosphoesterase family protein, partial [Bacteroidota bacterium]
MRVVLLSDTHSYIDKKFLTWCEGANEIWHAGDIGNESLIDELQSLGKPLRIVFGNIDSVEVRQRTSENLIFEVQ